MKSMDRAKPDGSKAGSTPSRFSADDLAASLGITKRGVNWRATAENWPFEEIEVRGGRKKVFTLQTLPPDVQHRIFTHYGRIPDEILDCIPGGLDQQQVSRCCQGWDQALGWQKRRAMARLEVLRACDAFLASRNGSRRQGHVRFTDQYQKREISVEGWVYDEIKSVRRSQLYDWRKRYDEQGIAGLISNHGHNRGQTSIPLDQQQIILGCMQKNPRWTGSKIVPVLRGKFGESAAPRWLINRFLKQQREDNPALFSYLESPDEYKGRFQLALGNASEKAEYFLHWAEIDSTPADVICSDGKRYTIIGLIDVFSRKSMFQVSKSSNSWGIAALLRRVFSEWGLVENLVRDHGKDYESRMVSDALTALNVNCPWIPPFAPKAKPVIERMFRTLSGALEERLSGYIGHSVAERRAIEARRSFADRFMKRGETVEIGLTPRELQTIIDTWTEEVYHQRRQSSLGRSPNAQAASVPHRPQKIEDPRALDILLARCGTRKVGKKGLRYENGLYWSDDLIDWIGRKIQIREDVRDAGRLYCFDPDTNEFICEALDMALSGITVAEKIRAQRKADKRIRERAKALQTWAAEIGDPVADEIEQARQRATIRNLPVGEPVEGNPFVDGALDAANARREREQQEQREPQEEAPIFDAASLSCAPVAHEQVADNPNVIEFPAKEAPEPVRPNRPIFRNWQERFHWLLVEQRTREIDQVDKDWLERNRHLWVGYAKVLAHSWDERDQRWLAEIAPDQFVKPVVKEDSTQ